MNPRPSSMYVRLALTLAILPLAACVEEPALDTSGSRPEYGPPEDGLSAPIVDGPSCTVEEPGCACVPGAAPITCTETEVRGDLVLCEAGASYCVEGVWSGCETVHSWEMPRPKIITAPGACSACNPDCFETDDEPDQADIDMPPPGSNITTNNVEFTTGPPRGIRPIPTMTTSMGGVDTDMDGVPDSADDCPSTAGTAAYFGCPTGTGSGGFFHVLPPGASALDPLAFDVALREADIYILIDRTGSMGGEIDNLRTGLATMVTNIRNTIPDTWFGIGRFDDLPISQYGTTSSTSNRVYYNLRDLTPTLSLVQASIASLTTVPAGGDWPEANSQGLYAMATGNGLNLFGTQYTPARTGCPTGRWGYPCFRPNVIPIVIMISDAEMHNGPTGLEYGSTTSLNLSDVNAGSIPNDNNSFDVGDITNTWRSWTGSTSNATNNYGIRCNSNNSDNSRDKVITFTVSRRSEYRFHTTGSSYDTYLYLYSGLPTSGFIECDDDDGGNYTSRITRTLNPGTYSLRIDGYSSDHGNFNLEIQDRDPEVFTPTGIPYATTIAALNARGIRFIGVNSGDSTARADMASVAADTNSLDGNGNAFIEDINGDGSGLSTAVVTAVQNLANYSRMSVDVAVQNVNILPGVPASALVQSITLGAPGCATRCTGTIPNGCSMCLPGTSLPFQVTFRNDVITPTAVDQVFNFDLIVRGNLGAIELQRVPVRIVVPGNVPTTTYMSGTFSRTFDATETCDIPPTRPDWGLFQWEVSTPGTTSVVFQFRTAETEAELNSQSPVTISVPTRPDAPTTAQFVDIGDLLTSMGGQNYLPYMRVTAVLNPDAAGTTAPTLTSMGLQYSCVDSE